MKKVFTKTIVLCLALAISLTGPLSGPLVAYASGGTVEVSEDWINKIVEDYNAAMDQIRDLQDQLRNAQSRPPSTPRPVVYDPKVKLVTPQTVSVNPGEALEVELTVRNIGTSAANSVLTQAVPSGNSPFSAEFLEGTNSSSSISENASHKMKLLITADTTAEPGTYEITLNHAYKSRDSKNMSETDTLHVRVTGSAQTPNIMLSGFRTDKAVIMPGDTFTLSAVIENMGDGEAKNVQTALEGLDADKLYLTSDLNKAYFQTMDAKASNTVSFTFATTARAKNGTYPLTFGVTYNDASGNKHEGSFTYYVNVVSAASGEKSFVEIREINAPGGTVNVDQNAVISMQVFNNSSQEARNVKITATPSDDGALVPKTSNIQLINSLPAGTGNTVSFTFSPTASASTRSYVVGFLVAYETGAELDDGSPEVLSFEQYASVSVNNPEKEAEDPSETGKSSKPKMIVSEYSVDPQIVSAGREFDLKLTFQNASLVKAVNNIKITLTAVDSTERKGAVFTPVGGSNTFYIDDIGPKGEVSEILRMFAVPDAEPRTYNINVSFNYQDEDYNDYEEHEQISINVKQVTRIEISEPYIPESVPVFQPVYINFNIINSGRVSLSNLRVRVDGGFDAANADMYIGNLGKGNSLFYEGSFTPMETGDLQGSIVVYGEDDTGELIEFSSPFKINAYEMNYEDFGGEFDRPDIGIDGMEMPGGEETAGNKLLNFIQKPYFWGPLAGVIVVGIIVTVAIVRRKKQRIDFDE